MNAPTKQQHAQSFDFWIVIVISIFWRTCTEKYEIKNIKFDKTSQHSTPKKINHNAVLLFHLNTLSASKSSL